MFKKQITTLLKELTYGGHILSLGASGITLTIIILLNLPIKINVLIISYLICQVVYNFNRLREIDLDLDSNPKRTKYIKSKRANFLLIGYTVSLVIFILFTNLQTIILTLLISLGGILYTEYLKNTFTRKIVGFKNFYTSLFVSLFILLVPVFYQIHFSFSLFYLILFLFLRFFVNTTFFDLKDVVSDKKRSLKTFFIVFGKRNTIYLLHIINIASLIPLVLGILSGNLSSEYIILGTLVFYGAFYISKGSVLKDENLRTFSYIIVDGEYIFWPILALLIRSYS